MILQPETRLLTMTPAQEGRLVSFLTAYESNKCLYELARRTQTATACMRLGRAEGFIQGSGFRV